ncbi:MAG TPA: F0F1 ATP synthase subunit B [Candidatus Saccharimonadales bacterium]|nr:F0F1 ATP synthase subunit B [Candidatus Saccharimonadales bacterium]
MLEALTYLAQDDATLEHAAATTEQAGGIAALGLNWQAFLFQLITFVIVLLILRKFVYSRLVKTLDDRRTAVETSLEQAAETAKKLESAEKDIAKMIADARAQADEVVAASRKEANQLIADAEAKASRKADHIVVEAKSQMEVELSKAREALKRDTAKLIALATETVIGEKLDATKDEQLISKALKNAKEQMNG